MNYTVTFDNGRSAKVPANTLITEAMTQAGVYVAEPCGGQGRCGRCAVKVVGDGVRRRSTVRLSPDDVAEGYALACQTAVTGDVQIIIPDQDMLERHLTMDRVAAEVQVPVGYDPQRDQTIRRLHLSLTPPSMDDQTDDWSRLLTAVRRQTNLQTLHVSLPLLRKVGTILREGNWQATAIIEDQRLKIGESDPSEVSNLQPSKLIELLPGHVTDPVYGLAIDIGTTTVSVWLVDLLSGQVVAQAAEYNRQIRRGEDVISRVIYASKNGSNAEMRNLVLESINTLVERVCQKANKDERLKMKDDSSTSRFNLQSSIFKASIVGNSIMLHLLLGIPAESIRLSPFVTAVNHYPTLTAQEIGLDIHPTAVVDCLPGVASYVGADITAGVLSSGLDDTEQVSLFMDIGTNGETVLGCKDWLVTCACSAGPAFEGAGVGDGMRATRGAIEEVWIDGQTFEPTMRIIGNSKPKGLCGSGLISLLAEMFLTGVIDKGGHFNTQLNTDRIQNGEHGQEYVIAWADETWHGRNITINHVDIDNLIRTKAAIYAGFAVLAESIGVPLEMVEQILIGGSFGKYINVEKAVQIGLLPDKPWDDFKFLGNTAVLGAYQALLSQSARQRISDIANKMTYIELSADNSFYEAFTSALFLPHTDSTKFPSVLNALPVMNA